MRPLKLSVSKTVYEYVSGAEESDTSIVEREVRELFDMVYNQENEYACVA